MKPDYTVIKIEQGIPIQPRSCGGKWNKILFSMKEGDSFLVPTSQIRCAVLSSAIHLSVNVTTRKVDGEGYRIWRIK